MLELFIRFLTRFVVSVVLSAIVYQLFIVVRYYKIFKFSLKNNGLFAPLLPFVGNIYVALFVRGKANVMSILLWADEYVGLPLNLWFGHKYHYFCNNAEEARIVLNHPKCYNKAEGYKDIERLFRNSILTAPSESWKLRRHYLRTAFKSSKIKNFYPIFNHQSDLLNKKLESLSPNEDLFHFFNKYAFMNFFLTEIGMDIESANADTERFGELLDSVQNEFVKLLTNPLIPYSIWTKTSFGAKFRYLWQQVENIQYAIMMERKELRAKSPEYVNNLTDLNLIDLLLNEDYEKLGESRFELVFFAAAATDTSGHTLAFCFTLLGMHPEVQQRVYEEVITSIGDCRINSGNIHLLKYTEAVISETLRIFPIIPLYGRRCDEDIDLGTKVIPKGANVIVSAFHIHRSPEYWKDPLKYEPTRFLPENVSKIIPGSYLPFSIGARNCLGKDMAIALLKITVANVVRRYRITSRYKSVNDFKLESYITMKASHHLDCNFTPRT